MEVKVELGKGARKEWEKTGKEEAKEKEAEAKENERKANKDERKAAETASWASVAPYARCCARQGAMRAKKERKAKKAFKTKIVSFAVAK